jgi:diacylglycerol kinase (ATP)
MYYYIVNPAAGGARINKIQDKLIERLKRLGIYGDFVKSTGADDVGKLAKLGISKGYKTIVAVGGDGTINEVMNAILEHPKVALGIIPMGTTNDLADALGITDWFQATGILAARKIEEIPLGHVGDRVFVTSVTVGFDPKIARLKQLSKGNFSERVRSALGIFGQASSYRHISANIRFDKKYEVEAECFNIVVASGIFSPVYLGKNRADTNKIFDTVVITKIPGAKALKYGYGSNTKEIEKNKISVFHADTIEIDSKKPTEVTADGQVVGTTPVKIGKTDQTIRVIVSKRRKI